MDKLNKLPPQDIKGLKDRPIASGLISNTIFQIVWNGIYFMIAWLVNHYALIFGIPPFLAIVFGVVAFFLMSLSVNLLRRRKEARALNGTFEPYPLEAQKEINDLKETLKSYEKTNENLGRHYQQYEPLIALAKKQTNEIGNWVKVKECERGDLILKPHVLTSYPKVMLCLWITNTSALEVAISNDLAGVIEFEGTELLEPKKIVNPIKSLETGETQCLTIEQRLSDSDVSMLIRSEHSTRPLYFNFDKLILNIIGGKRSPDISATQLEIEKHRQALAFPVSLQERLQRVRVLSEIRGHCIQLHEPLRKSSNQPLPMKDIEYWRDMALDALGKVYKDDGVKRVWQEITQGEPIPTNGSFQQNWLQNCIVRLGAMLEQEAGQFIRNTQNPLTAQHIS